MAKYDVLLNLKHKGEQYVKGETVTLNQNAAKRFEDLGYIKPAKEEKEEKKTATKSAKAAPKSETKVDEVTPAEPVETK